MKKLDLLNAKLTLTLILILTQFLTLSLTVWNGGPSEWRSGTLSLSLLSTQRSLRSSQIAADLNSYEVY